MTNINFLPTTSTHNQEKRLWGQLKWSPKGKCFDLLLSNSFKLFLKEIYRGQFGEFVSGYWDIVSGYWSLILFKGLMTSIQHQDQVQEINHYGYTFSSLLCVSFNYNFVVWINNDNNNNNIDSLNSSLNSSITTRTLVIKMQSI